MYPLIIIKPQIFINSNELATIKGYFLDKTNNYFDKDKLLI